MGDIFSKIWDLIWSLPPFVIVDENEIGVRLRWGKYSRSLGPGIHWRIPVLHKIIVCDCKLQTIDLPSQAIYGIVVEGVIAYTVADARKALVEVRSFDETMKNYALGAIGQALAYGITSPKELRKAVKPELEVEAQEWGLEVEDFQIKTFTTKVRSFKLFGEQF